MSTQTTLHQYGVLTRRQRQKMLAANAKNPNAKLQERFFGQELTNRNTRTTNKNKPNNPEKPVLKKKKVEKDVGSNPVPMELNTPACGNEVHRAKRQRLESKPVPMMDVSDEEEDENSILFACDEPTKDDPGFCTDKINIITKNFFQRENRCAGDVDATYMKKHEDLQPRMRRILLEWIDEVHFKFKLRPEVLYMAIAMIDRFLSKQHQSQRSQLQLIGCTCLWVASKYHEIYAPAMSDFVHMSADAFTTRDMLAKEEELLQTLDFRIVIPTPLTFAQRFLKVATFNLSPEHAKRVHFLTLYMMELSVMRYDLLKYKPSQIAAACTFCAVTMTGYSRWHDDLIKVTTYRAKDLKDLIRYIQNFVFSKDLANKHRFVKKKYSKTRFAKVGLLQPRKRTRNQTSQ